MIIVEDPIACTPAGLIGDVPCLACLSEKELLMVLVAVLAIGDNYTLPTDTNKLLKDSACFTCLSDKQLFQALVRAVANKYIGSTFTEAEGQAAIKCLRCANEKQLKAAVVYLTCELFSQVLL